MDGKVIAGIVRGYEDDGQSVDDEFIEDGVEEAEVMLRYLAKHYVRVGGVSNICKAGELNRAADILYEER